VLFHPYTCTTLRANTIPYSLIRAVHIVPVFFGSAVSKQAKPGLDTPDEHGLLDPRMLLCCNPLRRFVGLLKDGLRTAHIYRP
jgi:hypothetical protein